MYLLPNTLGGTAEGYATQQGRAVVAGVRHYIIEEIRSARRLMRALGYTEDFSDVNFAMLNEHTKEGALMNTMMPLIEGNNMAIISEAGLPCVADPGKDAVLLAHQMGVRVVPLSGSSSILMALMASGLNGQQFTFNGYLPRARNERTAKLRQLEGLALKGQTQLFMDAPYRNNQVLEDALTLKGDLHLCIATNISLENERINTKSISDWKLKKPDLHKQLVMFVLGR